MRFFKCNKCGNFITFLTEKSGCTPMCCGEEMVELTANTTDGALEKHVPAVEVSGNTVCIKVGEVEHPMLDNHYIQFVILETDKGYMKKDLKPGETPAVSFVCAEGEKPVAAYEYCNLHGLWKKEI
ncbi:MAG: desulfoferrodoxin Dfx [Lachnospiraceae bacterium]|nr:desulfoferrodoxin Dfx [Lachnospiraceae bacterium]